MENGPKRATFWKEFIAERVQYPAPSLLRDQLEHAEFTEFCACGCNSFGLRVDPAHAKPLLPPWPDGKGKGHYAVYTADFMLADQKTLEIVIFANDQGHLVWIDVDCCANSYPVPEEIDVNDPFHTWATKSLYR
jgi:hypothetical protein